MVLGSGSVALIQGLTPVALGQDSILKQETCRSFWWEGKMDSRMIRQEVRRTERPTKR